MRHWNRLQYAALHGTDYNPRLVEWCKQNLSFAEFKVNTLSGGLPYESETFDFIYAFSVFTHLSEPLQSVWMKELARALRPGGYIYFTTHGDYFLPQLSAEEKEKFLSDQLVVEPPKSLVQTCAPHITPSPTCGEPWRGSFQRSILNLAQLKATCCMTSIC